jgi:outer membrane protein OmpA-like peptidoglycan-associated protein
MLTLLTALAYAADPIALEVTATAQVGQAKPALVLIVNQDASDVTARVDCGTAAWAATSGGARKGERIPLELDVPVGTHTCTGTLSARFMDGTEGEMPLSFQVVGLPPLDVQVPRDQIDMESRTLSVIMDRTPSKIEVQAYGPGDVLLGEVSVPAIGVAPGDPVEVQYTGEGEVIRLHVVGYDQDGFWSAVDLMPWFYEIPHEDVIFESGKSEILAAEEPKLEAALAEVQAVLDKYGSVAEVKLYVGGYTDTVGDRGMNQRLSQKRAAAIAVWFRDHGFEGEIYYQGFGEDALAVPTGDETDQAENRRAVYILAAEAPPPSTNLPRSAWSKL